ncbi:MAG: polyisoprenoid-binding protein, partial [Candidatus Nephrothrix sp. EaCA]
TQSEKRDEHLKGPDFFDADKFPTFSFKGASFKKVSGNHYELKGALTLHGVTKPLVLKVDLKGKGEDPFAKKAMAGFKVYGKVKRTDFN